jgi:hypothetical protein
MRILLLALLGISSAFAQATVYLRSSGGPAGFTIKGATNATPIVLNTDSAHGLSIGDRVIIWGVCGTTAANGLRKVKAISDSTHFSITDLSNVDVAGNGAWCSGVNGGTPAAAQGGSKVTNFTTAALPRGDLDGPSGTITRKLSLGTDNGLTSIVVSSNVATVTTSYTHGVAIGDKVAIWNTTSSALNASGSPYTVTGAATNTFTFTTSGVANGDYTTNNTCGVSGTANCVRVSQLAYTGNPWWDGILSRVTNSYVSGVSYKFTQDGGSQDGGTSRINFASYYAAAATQFFVDQKNTQMRDVALYAINRVEALNGVNWTGLDGLAYMGNVNFNDFGSYVMMHLGHIYQIVRDYLSPTEKQAFLDKIYNDWNDPAVSACTSPSATNQVLASGTAQAGSSSTITLAAGDAAADNYYVNNVVKITVSGTAYYGVVSGYVASTKVATITGNWGAASPAAGTAYSIYATITLSGTTITGYNTTFSSTFSAGDAVMGLNSWTNVIQVQPSQSYISSIASDTSMTVVNGSSVTANATPSIMWIEKKWKTGDCGIIWLQKFWGLIGSQPSIYPPSGGDQTAVTSLTGAREPVEGSNNGGTANMAHILLDLVLAEDDPRAVTDLAVTQTTWLDYQASLYFNYVSGAAWAGAYYSYGRMMAEFPVAVAAIKNSVPSYPAIDATGAWVTGPSLFRMYSIYPEYRWSGNGNVMWPSRWGAQAWSNQLDPGSLMQGSFMADAGLYLNPTADSSKYLKYFFNQRGIWSSSWLVSTGFTRALLHLDPRYPSSDHTVQPTQYLFQATSNNLCVSLTARPCPNNMRGDMVISRTGWSNETDTHVMFGARSFLRDHDLPQGGTVRVYKAGHLLNADGSNPGALYESDDSSNLDNLIQFGGTKSFVSGPPYAGSIAYIARWAGSNSGSWASAYGDQNSRYAYAMADLAGMYTTVYNRVNRHIVHLKKPGSQEVIVQFDDIDTANSPTQIRTQVHYPQNGQASVDGMSEGTTTCPGANGCAGLDSDRWVQSVEDGTTHSHSTVVANYGVTTKFLSPGTVFIRSDGSAYTGGQGYTHRVSMCGGASCGATVNGMELLTIHRIGTIGDIALTATALNPDSNWTGVQTTDKVVLFARGGTTKSTLTTFTSSVTGTGQYLFAGLTPGISYNVNVNGSAVTGSPFPVSASDNTIYFEAGAGTVSLSQGALTCSVLTTSLPPGIVNVAYSQTLQGANCTGAITWSVSAGSLCAGLSLNSGTGAITGTPTTPQSCSFTIQAVDTVPTTATQPLSITISPASQTATPVISPSSGQFTGLITVSITCATGGSTIYYTTDGSVPDVNSRVYAGTFSASPGNTIRAVATSGTGSISEYASAVYVTPPSSSRGGKSGKSGKMR